MIGQIEQLKQDIAKRRQTIAHYNGRIYEIESADFYDHPYWQGVTDECLWEKRELARELALLEELQGE